MHPADQIVSIMNRIYQNGLTTTSGGNLSILDESGDIWITPSGVDKGTLTRDDIVCVKPGREIIGRHKPSIELPFHASVYKRRPDFRAVLHAHPPKTVAFSVLRRLPEINLKPTSRHICEKLTIAPYAVPGSAKLGDIISSKFAKGFNIVVMENHGLVVGGKNLFECYMKFETLEAAAELQILANKIGKITPVCDSDFAKFQIGAIGAGSDTTRTDSADSDEFALRYDMITFIRRSCRQDLFGCAHGTISAKLADGGFLITPHGFDRAYITENDLVLIKNGKNDSGKTPSLAVGLHAQIYEKHPDIKSIITAEPPHAMAFAVTDAIFDARTIPESYILLRNIKKTNLSDAVDTLCEESPVLICENNQILATGDSMLKAFDRLEVCEATAKAIISAVEMGEIIHISDDEIKKIDHEFNLKYST
ncbi:MAG: class II aldolase/adducin family protein [Defluviitaleaceae bacterium]|nr:class II aldolase/adducin family protein [Defluviitaleaceae bacterium]